MAAKRILIVAGEASGDVHAARLIKEVHQLDPNIHFYGMGGVNMRNAGADISIDIKKLAVVGIFDVLFNLRKIFRTLHILRDMIKADPPDLLVLVDYPGFNLLLAKIAKKLNVKVFYYITPKLWASRARRIKTIRKCVDKMAVIFPFEVDYYKQFNYPVTFVGNPLSDTVKTTMIVTKAKQEFGLNTAYKTIGLFPGSRKGEIKHILPVILKSAELLKKQFKNIQFIMPLASSLNLNDLAPYLQKTNLDIKIITAKIYDVMQVCDVAIAVSGTVTLETALMGIPMVIIYRAFPQFLQIHWFTTIPYIGLCNIVGGKKIVQELLQQHANPTEITAEISRILTDTNYRENMIAELHKVKDKLIAEKEATVAEMIIGELV